jgi:hypothetical protein
MEDQLVMEYMLTLHFPTREQAQLWVEDTFDLSLVSIKGIWASPFRSEQFAKIEVVIAEEARSSFNDGLARMKNVYPEDKRILLYWDAIRP